MTERIIPVIADSSTTVPLDLASPAVSNGSPLDKRSRPLRDLRISVTDRCNFRCVYCMPKEVFDKNYEFLPHSSLLTFEEIERVARTFVELGVEKLRLTGGEPLLRKNIEILIEKLAKLQTPTGKNVDITLTTNATLLKKKAKSLFDAGLSRVTVSLDAIDDAIFKAMNDVDFSVDQVLEGIEKAHQVGLGPIKVNMVVKGSVNANQVIPMARHFKSTSHILRFIEFMDVGSSNGWKMDEVLPSRDIISMINNEVGELRQVDPNYRGEVAERWQYADGSGEIGVISSVTQAFCHDCSRIRLSTEGKLYTCLFADRGHDIRPLLRANSSGLTETEALSNAICNLWSNRGDRYSEIRTANTTQSRNRIEMSYIGG